MVAAEGLVLKNEKYGEEHKRLREDSKSVTTQFKSTNSRGAVDEQKDRRIYRLRIWENEKESNARREREERLADVCMIKTI